MGATGACWKVAGGWKEVGEVPRVLLVLSWLLLAQLMGSTGSSTLVGACAAPSAVTAITGESKFREKQAEEIARGVASLSLEIWTISGSSPNANSKSKFVVCRLLWQ